MARRRRNWQHHGDLMTISNAINNVQISQVNLVVIAVSGSYTPPSNLLWADIECVGGGAGSGGVNTTGPTTKSISAGGGAGGFSRVSATRSQLAPSTSITIGSGGAGGAPGVNDGVAGGTTIVGSLCQATGGLGSSGGVALTTYTIKIGQSAGSGSGGDVNTDGASGLNSYQGDSSRPVLEPQAGGASYFGGGGFGSAGIQGGGGGGVGNPPSTAAQAGLSGGDGLVVITEYLSK